MKSTPEIAPRKKYVEKIIASGKKSSYNITSIIVLTDPYALIKYGKFKSLKGFFHKTSIWLIYLIAWYSHSITHLLLGFFLLSSYKKQKISLSISNKWSFFRYIMSHKMLFACFWWFEVAIKLLALGPILSLVSSIKSLE